MPVEEDGELTRNPDRGIPGASPIVDRLGDIPLVVRAQAESDRGAQHVIVAEGALVDPGEAWMPGGALVVIGFELLHVGRAVELQQCGKSDGPTK